MITNFFIPELNNHDVHGLWFQQDGATCHTARAIIDLLKDTFGDRLISRFGPVNWLPRSCDLTPLDYFLWGYVKSLVYADKPQTLDHLEDNIRRVISDIRPQMLEKVIENWTSRLDYIRASRGSPMPEIIFKIYQANSELFHEKTIPYNSESNGQAERANRVLLERARSLLYESKAPLKFWAEAINCTQISSVTPRKGKEKFPLEIWTAIENDNSIPLQTTSSPRTGRIQIPVLELNDVQNQIPVRRSERLKSKLMSVHLVNNVPNSYFEAENSANWKNWKLAMENELDSLDKHKVWEIVRKPTKSKLIKTKWVFSLKQDDAVKNIKYKARLVAAVFNQIKNIDSRIHQF
ncbi:retrovirus-related Pol polyprotein from transposon TNT 1-94 [Trichonephila clavipes]|nr:retrovirus-related Pol polyprotein from transposon TNT 1-94 [Trichonephila clavipes]